VADIAAYDAVYQKLIRSVRLSKVSSAFAMEEIKHTTRIPLPRQHSSAALAISPRRPR
jgi:Lrp/AsnC family transcriptional regulator